VWSWRSAPISVAGFKRLRARHPGRLVFLTCWTILVCSSSITAPASDPYIDISASWPRSCLSWTCSTLRL
jgi:hypothetical protein